MEGKMNDFFQNMLKQTSTTIAHLNDQITDLNKNVLSSAGGQTAAQNNTGVETMDLSPAGILNTVSKFINPQAAKTFLQGSGADDAILPFLSADVTSGIDFFQSFCTLFLFFFPSHGICDGSHKMIALNAL